MDRGIAYGNGHFVAVGENGTILQSGSIIHLSIMPDASTGLLSLSLEGPTGLDYTIQTSLDLISWQDVTKITSAQSGKIILDGLPISSGRTFYRAFSPNGCAQGLLSLLNMLSDAVMEIALVPPFHFTRGDQCLLDLSFGQIASKCRLQNLDNTVGGFSRQPGHEIPEIDKMMHVVE